MESCKSAELGEAMLIEIEALDEVPENKLKKIIKDFAQDGANIVTAINDGVGTFSVEATFIDEGPQGTIKRSGKMSVFGGPADTGVSPSEGLALIDDIGQAPDGLFLNAQPDGTTGLARRLDPEAMYLACRWDYAVTPKAFLRQAKVRVSVEGKPPVDAHPVDWGPNVRTGRVVDLSPGLAKKLGLDTNDECKVEIPLPADTTISIPATRPAGVDVKAVDEATFPANMTRTLLVLTSSDRTSHWVTKLIGSNEGGQTLMRQVGNKAPEILRSDSVILPIKADDEISDLVAGELNKAVPKEPDIQTDPSGPSPGAGDDIHAKVFVTAKSFVGHSTRNVPGTERGNLACAWAVNEVVRIALGKPISGSGNQNGLGTADMFDKLKAHHTRIGSANQVKPGMIIIAPTQGSKHGHVGIVGATTGTVNETQVFSNKSVPGVFARNFTIQSFRSHYTGLGLQVLFFALNADQF